MKYLGYDIPLGLSASSHSTEQIKSFIDHGFTHFEIGIPAALPGAAGLSVDDASAPESLELFARRAQRGHEEALVETQRERVKAITETGLRVWSVHLPFGPGWDAAHFVEDERDAVAASLRRVIDLTKAWGPKVYVLHGCLEPVAPEERPIRIARSIRTIRELNEYAARFGAQVALENLPRSCLANTAGETRAMIQAAGHAPVVFDVNHLLGEGHDTFLNLLAPYVISTHLSDYDGIDERHWLPGQGIVPWQYIVTRLMTAGYRGPFLFELRTGEDGPYGVEEVLKAWDGVMRQEID